MKILNHLILKRNAVKAGNIGHFSNRVKTNIYA